MDSLNSLNLNSTYGELNGFPLVMSIIEFFLNAAELSSNSVNSGNSEDLINHLNINLSSLKILSLTCVLLVVC